MRYRKHFSCTIAPNVAGTDQHCFRERGVPARVNGWNAEKDIICHDFLQLSQGCLASIVVLIR